MENHKKEPTLRNRRNMDASRIENIPLDELFMLYINECRIKNLADVTIKGYEYAYKYFKIWLSRDITCDDVTQDLINKYVLYLKDKLGKPQTVNSYQFKISPVIKYGCRKGYIKDNIVFTHLVEQEHIKDIYSKEELAVMLKKPKGNSFAEFRTWVIINMLLATGIRATELRELKIRNVDTINRVLSLEHTKNRKPRVIPIPSSLYLVLKEYLYIRNGSESECLFCNIYGEPLPRTTLQMRVTKYCKSRRLTRYSLHLFRHAFITECVKNGMPIVFLKRITGHSSFAQLNRYYQYNPTDLVDIVDNYNPLERLVARKKKF